MKLYQYERNDGSAFNEALVDYMRATGKNMPVSMLNGETPETRKGKHGKPYFAEQELKDVFFSRSHSHEYEIVCFSDSEIGVDCEDLRARKTRTTDFEKIAKRCFAEDEYAYIMQGRPGAVERFFDIWTAKEAYVKYTGRGFSEGFSGFSVFRLPEVIIDTGRLEGAPHVVYSVCRSNG